MSTKRKPRRKPKPVTTEQLDQLQFGRVLHLRPPYLDRQRLGIPQNKPHWRRFGK